MFVSALAAGLIMFADVTPAMPAPTGQAAKPEMKRVCVKSKSDNTNIPKVSCYMQAMKPAPTEVAKVGEGTEASSTTH
jgi:hypothetical protein